MLGGDFTSCLRQRLPELEAGMAIGRNPYSSTAAIQSECSNRDEARDENAAAASEVVVEGFDQPTSDQSRAEVRCAIDEALKPNLVTVDVEIWKIECLCTIDCGLIHLLNDG